jgi:general L-amino acid transport system substrate-binding protein
VKTRIHSSENKKEDIKMKKLGMFVACFMVLGLVSSLVASPALGEKSVGETLNSVIARDELAVGVYVDDILGLISEVATDDYIGLEADFAIAVAAAVFNQNTRSGAESKIKWIRCDSGERFTYLNLDFSDPNHIDLGCSVYTYTSGRDVTRDGTGFEFTPIYYYDGTNVLLRSSLPATVNILVDHDSANRDDLERLEAKGPGFWPDGWNIVTAESGFSDDGFIAGTYNSTPIHGLCSDYSFLYSVQQGNLPNDWEFHGLIGKAPLCGAVKEADTNGDQNWLELVRWVFNVIKQAEEDGYSSGSLPPASWYSKLKVPGLNHPDFVQNNPDWPEDVIAAVGNYDEIWQRNFPGVPRGDNALWKNGGLHISPPFGN